MTKISKPKEHKGQILMNEYKKYLVSQFFPAGSHTYKRGWRVEFTSDSLFTTVRKYRSLLLEGFPASIMRVDSKYPFKGETIRKFIGRYSDETK